MATGSSEPAFTIRRATLEDLPQLQALIGRYYDEWHVVQRDSPGRIAEYVASPEPCGFLVAGCGERLAACVLIRELPALGSALECKRLYVLPEHRGCGLASRLMDEVERVAAHHADWLFLDTGQEFAAAQALYRTRGYETCERYNDNPQAVFFYRKRLRN